VLGVVDENPPHHRGGIAVKVYTIFPVNSGFVHKLFERSVDEVSRLKRRIVASVQEDFTGYLMQFLIDMRSKLIPFSVLQQLREIDLFLISHEYGTSKIKKDLDRVRR